MNRILPAVVVLCVASAPLSAQAVLKGLTGINVGVLIEDQIQKQHRDLQYTIQRDVEVKARVAGLEILSSADLMSKPRFTISVVGSNGPGFFVTFAFAEPAFLERDRTIRVQAATWLRQGVVFSLDENEIRRTVKDWTDEFLSDWIIQNPRPRQ
ncbi:MAG: hypothetical protein ABSB15_00945 [Bryobacteraceae bacterium]|jgi:hypothetical protein